LSGCFFGILFNSLFSIDKFDRSLLVIDRRFELRRIRESDEIIFDDLKKIGLFNWFFMPARQNNYCRGLFSALFLLISWLAVGLVKLNCV